MTCNSGSFLLFSSKKKERNGFTPVIKGDTEGYNCPMEINRSIHMKGRESNRKLNPDYRVLREICEREKKRTSAIEREREREREKIFSPEKMRENH